MVTPGPRRGRGRGRVAVGPRSSPGGRDRAARARRAGSTTRSAAGARSTMRATTNGATKPTTPAHHPDRASDQPRHEQTGLDGDDGDQARRARPAAARAGAARSADDAVGVAAERDAHRPGQHAEEAGEADEGGRDDRDRRRGPTPANSAPPVVADAAGDGDEQQRQALEQVEGVGAQPSRACWRRARRRRPARAAEKAKTASRARGGVEAEGGAGRRALAQGEEAVAEARLRRSGDDQRGGRRRSTTDDERRGALGSSACPTNGRREPVDRQRVAVEEADRQRADVERRQREHPAVEDDGERGRSPGPARCPTAGAAGRATRTPTTAAITAPARSAHGLPPSPRWATVMAPMRGEAHLAQAHLTGPADERDERQGDEAETDGLRAPCGRRRPA